MTNLLANSRTLMVKRLFVTKVNLATENLPVTLLEQPGEVVTEEGDCINLKHHGGHLQLYWQVSEKHYCHPRVVQILRGGYRIIPQS